MASLLLLPTRPELDITFPNLMHPRKTIVASAPHHRVQTRAMVLSAALFFSVWVAFQSVQPSLQICIAQGKGVRWRLVQASGVRCMNAVVRYEKSLLNVC